MKAETKKANEIHDYYIILEELLQETLNEESDELRNQLEEKSELECKICEQSLDHKLFFRNEESICKSCYTPLIKKQDIEQFVKNVVVIKSF